MTTVRKPVWVFVVVLTFFCVFFFWFSWHWSKSFMSALLLSVGRFWTYTSISRILQYFSFPVKGSLFLCYYSGAVVFETIVCQVLARLQLPLWSQGQCVLVQHKLDWKRIAMWRAAGNAENRPRMVGNVCGMLPSLGAWEHLQVLFKSS